MMMTQRVCSVTVLPAHFANSSALRTGVTPMGEVHANLASLAMVEAAIESNRTGRRVLLADIMSSALDTAMETETRVDVGQLLKSWHAAGGYSHPPSPRS